MCPTPTVPPQAPSFPSPKGLHSPLTLPAHLSPFLNVRQGVFCFPVPPFLSLAPCVLASHAILPLVLCLPSSTMFLLPSQPESSQIQNLSAFGFCFLKYFSTPVISGQRRFSVVTQIRDTSQWNSTETWSAARWTALGSPAGIAMSACLNRSRSSLRPLPALHWCNRTKQLYPTPHPKPPSREQRIFDHASLQAHGRGGPKFPLWYWLPLWIEQAISWELSGKFDATCIEIKMTLLELGNFWRMPGGWKVLHRPMYTLSVGHECQGVEQTRPLSSHFYYLETPDRKIKERLDLRALRSAGCTRKQICIVRLHKKDPSLGKQSWKFPLFLIGKCVFLFFFLLFPF